MAVTSTPKLGLNKQDLNDPNWHSALNAGFDAADARFIQYGSGSPTGVAAGHWVGQIYIQTGVSPMVVWLCTTVGTPGIFARLSQLPTGALMENNVALQAREVAAGTGRDIAKISNASIVQLGNAFNQLRLFNPAASNAEIDTGAGVFNLIHAGNLAAALVPVLTAALIPVASPVAPITATQVEQALDQIGAFLTQGFSASSTSSDRTIANGTLETFAHGLTVKPKMVVCKLVCQTADGNWAPGEIFELCVGSCPPINFNGGHGLYTDTTNVFVRFGSTGPHYVLQDKNSGSQFNATDARWKLRMTAFA